MYVQTNSFHRASVSRYWFLVAKIQCTHHKTCPGFGALDIYTVQSKREDDYLLSTLPTSFLWLCLLLNLLRLNTNNFNVNIFVKTKNAP